MRPLLRLEDEQHCCAISASYLWTTPQLSPVDRHSSGMFWMMSGVDAWRGTIIAQMVVFLSKFLSWMQHA